MDEDEPRIIARGEWSQDEYGDILYTPTHIRPILSDDTQLSDARPGAEQLGDEQLGDEPNDLQPDGLRAIVRPRDDLSLDLDGEPDHATDHIGGYRIRSDEVWDRARRDFLAGDTAASVCDRYDLRLGTFKHRAAREGWRRSDQPDPEPVDLEAEAANGLPDYVQMAAHALIRSDRALRRGRAPEAAAWLRLHQRLSALAPTPPRQVKQPDPYAPLMRRMAEIRSLARDLETLDADDAEGRNALEARLKALDAVSDHSDLSDPVSNNSQV